MRADGDHIDWERTSLKLYVQFLDAHIKGIMEDVRKAKMNTTCKPLSM